jgi:uncharacterized protein (TIGR02466 family)
LFQNNFEQHEQYKPAMIEYLSDRSVFEKNTNTDRLLFTHPNLNKQEPFKPLTDFVNSNLTEIFPLLGFKPSFQLTGMWATKHPRNGFHHRHNHGNSFMAGIYYLDGEDNNSSGTNFYSTHYYNNMIIPARLENYGRARHSISSLETIPFQQGKLIIFPSWAIHDTNMNNVSKTRTIISFNIMPVGKTNNDCFDRYDYKQAEPSEMINELSERI